MYLPITQPDHRIRVARCVHWTWLIVCNLLLLCLSQPLLATELTPGEPPLSIQSAQLPPTTTVATEQNGLTVNPQNRAESRQFFQTNYANVDSATHNWNGNQSTCAAGDTTPEFRATIALRINYYRAMAGVPADISFADEYNAKAQQAALVMSVNEKLSHEPTEDWTCYSAESAMAAGKSNLYLGVFGPAAIDGYMQDPGDGNDAVGHRRWLLYPQTQLMGVGDIPPVNGYHAANALWVFDDNPRATRPTTREEFVAWPPPGYIPDQIVFPRWSFAYPAADFTNATVTMTQNKAAVTVVLATVQNGYGENTLVWTPSQTAQSWPKPTSDMAYEVTISNVTIGDATRTFTYTVTLFDPAVEETIPGAATLFLPLVRR